jgi:hypothetical protein
MLISAPLRRLRYENEVEGVDSLDASAAVWLCCIATAGLASRFC